MALSNIRYGPGIYVLNNIGVDGEYEFICDNDRNLVGTDESITVIVKNSLLVELNTKFKITKISSKTDNIITSGYNPN